MFKGILCSFMWMGVLPACMSVWYPPRPEEGTESPGTELTGGCELLCGSWEPNLGPSARASSASNHPSTSPAPGNGDFELTGSWILSSSLFKCPGWCVKEPLQWCGWGQPFPLHPESRLGLQEWAVQTHLTRAGLPQHTRLSSIWFSVPKWWENVNT